MRLMPEKLVATRCGNCTKSSKVLVTIVLLGVGLSGQRSLVAQPPGDEASVILQPSSGSVQLESNPRVNLFEVQSVTLESGPSSQWSRIAFAYAKQATRLKVAAVQHKLGAVGPAVETFWEVLQAVEEIQEPAPKSRMLTAVAQELQLVGEDDNAEAVLQRAQAVCESIAKDSMKAHWYARIGVAHLAAGRTKPAAAAMQAALTTAQKIRAPRLRLDALDPLVQQALASGNPGEKLLSMVEELAKSYDTNQNSAFISGMLETGRQTEEARCLLQAARLLAGHGKTDLARSLLSSVEMIAATIPEPQRSAELWPQLPPSLAEDQQEPALRARQHPDAGKVRNDNSLAMKLVYCPPGKYLMGRNQPGHWLRAEAADDWRFVKPTQPKVEFTQGYWIGQWQVTRAQWSRLMQTSPWTGAEEQAQKPATNLSWTAAMRFCRKLTAQERQAGRLREGWEFRLPTEAEWEYACRAGSPLPEQESDGGQALPFSLNPESSSPAASNPPHEWNLRDMRDKVAEWCLDLYSKEPAGGRNPINDRGLIDLTSDRVFRGGDCGLAPCPCDSRKAESPSMKWNDLGFRVVMGPVMDPAAASAADLEEVKTLFAAARQAYQLKQYRRFCTYFDDRGLTSLAAEAVVSGGILRNIDELPASEEQKAKLAELKVYVPQVTQLLVRHGYPQGNPPMLTFSMDKSENEKRFREYIKPIKDRVQFVDEMWSILNQIPGATLPVVLSPGGEIVRLSVDGDTAVGSVRSKAGQTVERAITCVLVGDQWKLRSFDGQTDRGRSRKATE